MPVCSKCGLNKPRDQFRSEPRIPSRGCSARCKSCLNAYDKAWRLANPQICKQLKDKWLSTPKGSESRKAARQRYDKANRGKNAARQLTKGALKRGELLRLPCEVCGEIKSEAHHDDYSRPLEIRWLCKRHHEEFHTQNTNGN